MKAHACLTRLFALMVVFLLSTGAALAAGIKVVPSTDRVAPGESFHVDIVAENIPAEGLGTVQFRLDVDAPGSIVSGVSDLNQAGEADVYVASPLLSGAPTSTRSGLGDLFLGPYQGSAGILVMDNETFSGSSALYTYAHTSGATPPSGSGSVARFLIKVGSHVAAEQIRIDLADVMLIDGGAEYPLDYNLGATVTLRCSVAVPDLAGMTLAEAQSALEAVGLSVGDVHEIDNPGSARPLGVVLEQSAAAGSFVECESAIDLAINQAPADVTGLSAADLAGDDTGKAVLNWTPSVSSDVSGYRVYNGGSLLAAIGAPQAGTATVGNLPIGTAVQLRVTALDCYGNESAGATVTATALDDVPPVLSFHNVADGAYYAAPVQPQLESTENHPAGLTATLNGSSYDWSTISADGVYTLVVTMTDTSGNSTTESIGFTVDRTAPVINVPNVVEGGYLNAILTPEIIISDLAGDDQKTVVTLNGQPYVPGTPIEGEGLQTLVITATDKAGNLSSVTVTFILDLTAPSITIDGVADGAWYKAGNQSSVTVTFIVDLTAPTITIDGVADGAWYKAGVTPQIEVVDASPVESTVTLNGNPFVSGTAVDAEGGYDLIVSATDAAGNEASRTVHFTIDLTPPSIEVAQVTDGAFYNSEVAPTVDIVDAALGESTLTLNGAPFVSGTPVSDEGIYALVVTAADLAGNEAARTVNFTIDKTAPAVEIAEVVDGAFYNTPVTPAITATDTYLAETVATLNGAPYVPGTPVSAEGVHELIVSASDLAGNTTSRTVHFTIDVTPPEIGIGDVADGAFYNHDVLPAITVTDANPAESSCTLNGAPYLPGTPVTAEGDYVLEISATDKAGNTASRTLGFGIDLTAPVIVAEGVADGAFVKGDVTPVVTVTEAHPAENTLTLNGEPFVSGATISQEGAYVLAGSCVDLAGNRAELTLSFVIDKAAPVSSLDLGAPKYQTETVLYATGAAVVTLSAGDDGPASSGVAEIAYTIDSAEPWTVYAQPFGLSPLVEGPHSLAWRATDLAGNREADRLLELTVDNSAPETAINLEGPRHDAGDRLFVSAATGFTLTAVDSYSGVAATEYRLDDGEWTPAAPFAIAVEGEHLIEYRSTDHLGNAEETRTLTVTVDATAPITNIAFQNQSFIDGDRLLLTAASQVILSATDDLAGLAGTYYRFDDQTDWRPYSGSIHVTDLPYGAHVMHFYSDDLVGNAEEAQSVSFILVGAEVKVELLNRPRVLVWTDDPGKKKHGRHAPSYTLDDIRNLVAGAMDSADAYVELVTEEEDFRENFRSGIFNVVMVLSQKEWVNMGFLRELRDAVEQGSVGLLVSSWGNSVHPILQDMFGLHFVGCMSMREEQRELHLFDSDVAQQAVLIAYGRILKTRLDGGVMAGMIPGESRCRGVRSVSFTYPETLETGDRITVSVYTQRGGRPWKDKKKLNLVDQEQMTVNALPSEGINNYTGNPAGDLAITSADAEALSFTLAGPYGFLAPDYLLEVRIEHEDGSVVESDLVSVTPTCHAHLWSGMNIGPFQVTAVEEDRVQISPDLPAVILNEFGKGRTVFLAYDIIESALKDDSGAHAALLGNSADYLAPESDGPEPAGIGLVQTTVSFEGAGIDLLAVDTLDPGLTHLSLFGLREPPLEYRFSLQDGTQAIYRYFVRFPDQAGDYPKKTELFLELDGTAVSYHAYDHVFTVAADSGQLLQQAMQMAEDLKTQHPRVRRLLDRILSDLQDIGALQKTTKADYERAIREIDRIILQLQMLHIDSDALVDVLKRYRRIMQVLQIDAEDDHHHGGHGHGWWRPKKREFYGPVPIDLLNWQHGLWR